MDYLTMIVHDKDYKDIKLFVYNEALDNNSDIPKFKDTCKRAVSRLLVKKNLDPKDYSYGFEVKNFKTISRDFKRYIFIEPQSIDGKVYKTAHIPIKGIL